MTQVLCILHLSLSGHGIDRLFSQHGRYDTGRTKDLDCLSFPALVIQTRDYSREIPTIETQPWPTAGSSHLSLHSFVLSTPSSRVVLDLIHSVVKRRASCSRDFDQMSMWAFPRTVISQLQGVFVLIRMCGSLRFDEHSVVTFSLCLPAISVPANWGAAAAYVHGATMLLAKTQ